MKTLILLALILASPVVNAADKNGPCQPAAKKIFEGRRELRECLSKWIKAARENASDPSDDCTGRTKKFVDATKGMKTCRADAKKQKEAELKEAEAKKEKESEAKVAEEAKAKDEGHKPASEPDSTDELDEEGEE